MVVLSNISNFWCLWSSLPYNHRTLCHTLLLNFCVSKTLYWLHTKQNGLLSLWSWLLLQAELQKQCSLNISVQKMMVFLICILFKNKTCLCMYYSRSCRKTEAITYILTHRHMYTGSQTYTHTYTSLLEYDSEGWEPLHLLYASWRSRKAGGADSCCTSHPLNSAG